MKIRYYQRLIALAAAMVLGLGATAPALASNTQVSQLISGGLLSLSAPTTATLSSTLVSFAAPNTTTGTLGQMEADDGRSSYAGWSLTATASSFVHIGQAIQTSGSIPTSLSTSGTYNGSVGGTYILTVTQGGARGTAQFAVSNLETQSAATIPANNSDVSIGTRGVLADFPDATYQIGESWRIPIAIIPASGLTLQPSATTARYGDLTGVHTGTTHTFTNDGDSATIMNADVGFGTGAYLNTPNLSLQIPPLSSAGFYFATITETLN